MQRELKGLYGFRHIDNELYKSWILEWDKEVLINLFKEITENWNEHWEQYLVSTIEIVKLVAENLIINKENPNDYYDSLYSYFSEGMFKAYFRADASSIRVANYYETLLEVSDYRTQKQLIKGFEHISRNGIDIICNGKLIGYLGTISDLFYAVFREEYIREDYRLNDIVDINRVRNIQEEFTLQLWEIPIEKSLDEINVLVEKIIYECSILLGLDFKRGKFEPYQKEKGNDQINFELNLSNIEYDREPLMYFNFANDTTTSRHKFVAYYQVIESYYKRAIRLARLPRAKEIDIVGQVIERAISISDIKSWLQYESYYLVEQTEYSAIKKLDINSEELLREITNRIYSVRCSIVHAKEAQSINDNFIPNLNDEIIYKEINLIRYVASRVLDYWSQLVVSEL